MRAATKRAQRGGFSLVEVMMVVAIIGVMSALAVPQISKAIARANEPAHVQRVHGFITEARNLARRTNQCVAVIRDGTGTTLKAEPVSTCKLTESCRCRESVLPAHKTTLQLPKNLTVSAFTGNTGVIAELTSVATGNTLLFLPDGSTPYTSIAGVEVKLPERGPRRLTVLPASGIVRVAP